MIEWEEMDSMYLKFRSRNWFWEFSLPFCAQEEPLNRRQVYVQDSVFSLPPFGGKIVILRAFICIIKTQFEPILGCITLLFKADPAHSSSKFGSDCLGDLAYTENQEPRTIAALPLSP